MKPYKLRFCVLPLLLAIASVSNVHAQVPPDAQIAGRIVRADKGTPIEGATVSLSPWGGLAGIPWNVKSDHNGEYYFEGLKSGGYSVQASAEGFVWTGYQRDSSLAGGVLKVDLSTRLRGVDLRLRREAVIRGRLIDTEGKPVGSGVFVAAVGRESREDGSKRLSPVSEDYTDANGNFALNKLLPGSYFVCVDGPTGYGPHPDPGGWYKESWYGDKPSAKGALQITLKEGGKQDGIEIRVIREKRYRVIVWPKGPQGNIATDNYDFDLSPRESWEVDHKDGSYVIPNIPPGHYTLVIHAMSGGPYIAQAEKQFDVVDRDVTLRVDVKEAVKGSKSEMTGGVNPR